MKTLLYLDDPFLSKWSKQDPFKAINTINGITHREIANRRTIEFSEGNQTYFIKIHQGVGWLEICKNIFTLRAPILSAKQEWLALNRLRELSISCPTVVGFGCQGSNPAKLQSFIITKKLENTQSLEDFCATWKSQAPAFSLKRSLIQQIAGISRLLHQQGIVHRDFYLCHFLMDLASLTKGKIKLSLIDLHRALLLTTVSKRWLIKDLGSLYFSALDYNFTHRDILRFIKIYNGASLKNSWDKQKKFWRAVEKKAITLYVKENHRLPKLPFRGVR